MGFLAPVHAQAGAALSGAVVDATSGGALSGILVTVTGTRGATLTDETGRYSIADLPSGTYEVRYSWLGYREHTVSVTLAAGETELLDVALEPSPIQLGQIVVTTASRQPERVVESPSAVSVAEPTRVQDLVVTDQFPSVVADLPGVYPMQGGVNSFSLNTRGFNGLQNRRMMVLIDGRDATAAILGTPEWPSISVFEDATAVELVRGPGSALYGANAFSGVLNVITPSVRQAPGTRITLGGGTLSSFRLEGRHALVTDDLRWGFRVHAGYSRTDTWDLSRTAAGDLDREYEDAVPANTAIATPPPGYEALPLRGQTKTGDPSLPGPVTGDPDPYTTAKASGRIDHYLFDGSVVTAEGGVTRMSNLVDASSVGRGQTDSEVPWARLQWAASDFNVMAHYTARSGESTLLGSGVLFEDFSSRAHLEGQLTRDLAGGIGSLVLGGSVRREKIDTKGGIVAPEHDGRSDSYYALFAQLRWDLLANLTVIAAGRIDDASLYDPEFAPKIGVVWRPAAGHSLRATLNRAYLMPSPTQRFLRVPLGLPQDLTALETGLRSGPLGPALATVPVGALFTNSAAVPLLALGNETADPEAVRSLELGYTAEGDRVFLTADAHYSRFESFLTQLMPGANPAFGPWTAPPQVSAADQAPVEGAVNSAVSGLTRLTDGSTAIVFSNGTAGEATQFGIDLSATVQVTDRVRLGSSYSYVQVDFKEGSLIGQDSIPANTPAHIGSLSASYASPDGLRARVSVTLVDEFRFEWGTWNGTVPSRQTVDLSLGYELTNQLRVNASATNLLGQARYHHFGGSVIGRRLVASLTWEP